MGALDTRVQPTTADVGVAPFWRRLFARPVPVPVPAWAGALLTLAGIVGLLAHVYQKAHADWTVDDAYISLRYAQNLLAGRGLVWNPGERVEGYSNPLWVFLLAPWTFDPDWGRVGLRVTGVAAALFAALTIVHHERRTGRSLWGAAAVVLAFEPNFALWTIGGLETVLYGALVTAVALWGDRPAAGGTATALVAVTRPEGVLHALWTAADGLLHAARARFSGAALRAAALRAGPALVVFAGWLVFRRAYYGEWLPNTYYAKLAGAVSHDTGIDYVRRFISHEALFWGTAAVGFTLRVLTAPAEALRIGAALGALAAYAVIANGDALPAFRWLTPAAPLGALLAADAGRAVYAVVSRATPFAPRIVAACATALALAPALYNLHLHGAVATANDDRVSLYGRDNGRFMRAHFPADFTIATNTAGTIPYYSGLRAIDMLGLADHTIARRRVANLGHGRPGHEKGDGAYVLRRAPELIQFCSAMGNEQGTTPDRHACFLSDRELAALPDFRRNYALVLYHTDTCGRGTMWTWLWVRRDVLARVTTDTRLRPVGEREGFPIWGEPCR